MSWGISGSWGSGIRRKRYCCNGQLYLESLALFLIQQGQRYQICCEFQSTELPDNQQLEYKYLILPTDRSTVRKLKALWENGKNRVVSLLNERTTTILLSKKRERGVLTLLDDKWEKRKVKIMIPHEFDSPSKKMCIYSRLPQLKSNSTSPTPMQRVLKSDITADNKLMTFWQKEFFIPYSV